MYSYDEFDRTYVKDRVATFRDQVARRISGALTEDEFKPLRLQNGIYLQLHAYMLRVAIPYGTLNSAQMRQLAMIAERWDKGYGHFTTRQNIQYNWPKLVDLPDILDALADVEMHAIQTSGNCIRNVTADHFAGAARDEIEDPRPAAELLRQWSTDHPEFAFLPRKFKIAVTGAEEDRAVTRAHDIGIQIVRNEAGEVGYKVIVGGGLGRTPVVGVTIRDFLPKEHLLAYCEAILRVYNLHGRRDNKYKARIKILVMEEGLDSFRAQVEDEFASLLERHHGPSLIPDPAVVERIEQAFAPPAFETLPDSDEALDARLASDPAFAEWCEVNLTEHREPGHTIVSISLKPVGEAPGDASTAQMQVVANLAELYSHDEVRVSHEQNLILPHVAKRNLPAIYDALKDAGLATANINLIGDIIACPGLDYCALATARSIPIAKDIAQHFADSAYARTIGEMKIKISGCINSCGHHHVGHIGILGLDKGGKENYQITLGGDHTQDLQLGQRLGPGFDAKDVVPAIERLVEIYLGLRQDKDETFLKAVKRVGIQPFKDALYPPKESARAA
ncbi:nitrite/sulfite reductase [Erythrobacter sp. SD-21]|uniref:nitrite/sulfite reductase n=1 Tax=Erythrobacter sp. SD-21 TaxID=161528 RepID=UPI000153F5AB|nr:nitrite/sulfite reductase [Erythrobacter sp. SD-21]EDL49356.1 Sulfite/nitrite reductase hemoprotein subunit [Erythrobacter sp. SD-21]